MSAQSVRTGSFLLVSRARGGHRQLRQVAPGQTLGEVALQTLQRGCDDAGQPGQTGGDQEPGRVIVDEGPHRQRQPRSSARA
jgi:hypothetical protein